MFQKCTYVFSCVVFMMGGGGPSMPCSSSVRAAEVGGKRVTGRTTMGETISPSSSSSAAAPPIQYWRVVSLQYFYTISTAVFRALTHLCMIMAPRRRHFPAIYSRFFTVQLIIFSCDIPEISKRKSVSINIRQIRTFSKFINHECFIPNEMEGVTVTTMKDCFSLRIKKRF